AIRHFPMIMVGNALSFPDTVSIRLLSPVNDSLLNDTIHTMFGNKKELIDFFIRNIVYPHQLKDLNMEDDLHLLMKIDKDGVLTESEVLNAEIPEMKQEVLRVSKLLPALLMTDKSGRKINSFIQLPISFRILKL
ncbi:MAG: energy transducer TonB, partial [Paludibacteraceae bacterium]|nr:energy transducer TonB [Paludibacteraceae bacterium]